MLYGNLTTTHTHTRTHGGLRQWHTDAKCGVRLSDGDVVANGQCSDLPTVSTSQKCNVHACVDFPVLIRHPPAGEALVAGATANMQWSYAYAPAHTLTHMRMHTHKPKKITQTCTHIHTLTHSHTHTLRSGGQIYQDIALAYQAGAHTHNNT